MSTHAIYTKNGSGLYSGNTMVLQGKQVDGRRIQFKVLYTDSDSGTAPFGPNNAKGFVAVDEYVVGTLNVTIDTLRATGSYVSTNAPTLASASFSGFS